MSSGQGREEAMENEHPDALTSVKNMALMLQDQRQYEAAERCTGECWWNKKALGKSIPTR
jgi:hypothetical protein